MKPNNRRRKMTESERFAHAYAVLARAGNSSSWRKRKRREETEDLVEDALAYGEVTITRVPTLLRVRCICGRRATVRAMLDKPPKLRCRKCGNRHPTIDIA